MRTPALLAAAVLLCACTQQQRETSAHEWAMTECNRMPDRAERQRCADRADASYGTGRVEQNTRPPR